MDKEPKNKIIVNKSHAGAYAVNSIRTAWCACHYPAIFRKALLNTFVNNQNKVKVYLADITNKKIELLPPSVNYSRNKFAMDGTDSIRFGLGGIKKVKNLAIEIFNERNERGLFGSYYNFVERMLKYHKCNKGAIENLVYAGALDEFEGTRKAKIAILDEMIEKIKSGVDSMFKGQLSIFDLDSSLEVYKEVETPDCEEFEETSLFFKEEEVTGLFITGHPLDKYSDILSQYPILNLSSLVEDDDEAEEGMKNPYLGTNVFVSGVVSDVKIRSLSSGKKMANFVLKDKTAEIRCVVFNNTLNAINENLLTDKTLVTIQAKFDESDFGKQLIVFNLAGVEFLSEGAKELHCTVSEDFDTAKEQGVELRKLASENEGSTLLRCFYRGKELNLKGWPKINLTYSNFSKIQKLLGEHSLKVV